MSRKRRYVRAQTIELVRDPASGVLVVKTGGDFGANFRSRIKRGEIEIRDRTQTEGGILLSKGAVVRCPGRVDALVLSGRFDPPAGDREESRRRILGAAERMRANLEIARVRPRTVGLYQPAQDRGRKELSRSQLLAKEWLAKAARAVGWGYYSAICDAIAFEDPLSRAQEELVAEGLVRLADWIEA